MSNILGTYAISIPNYGQVFYKNYEKYYTAQQTNNSNGVNLNDTMEDDSNYRLDDVSVIKEVIKLFEKYDVEYNPYVDTVAGSFDLNQEWIETKPLMLDVQYNGALPLYWSDEDRELFRKLNYDGKIITIVHWVEQQPDNSIKYIPNH